MKVDGVTYEDEVEPRLLLVHHLRDGLGRVGTPVGCDTSNCGACTLHLDGESVKSCSVLAVQADGAEITTIQGLAGDENGRAVAPGPEGVQGAPRPAVRLLHAGHDHGVGRPAEEQPQPDRGRGAARPGGQPLPLHRLPEHRQGGPVGGVGDARRGRAARLVPDPADASRRRPRRRRSPHDRPAGRRLRRRADRRGPGGASRRRTPGASSAAAAAARRTPSSSPARPTGPTTSSCRACCT